MSRKIIMLQIPLTISTRTHKVIQVVELPTIHSFLRQPTGTALHILEDSAIIQPGCQACNHCQRLLTLHHFSGFQRLLTAHRQIGDSYDYKSYKPEKHYCMKCGVKTGKYPKGETINAGFEAPRKFRLVVPCRLCGTLCADKRTQGVNIHCGACWMCQNCNESHRSLKSIHSMKEGDRCALFEAFVRANEPFLDDSKEFEGSCLDSSEETDVKEPDFQQACYLYPDEVLAMIGENVMEGT